VSFYLAVSVAVALASLYLWKRLVLDARLPRAGLLAASLVLGCGAALLPLVRMFGQDRAPAALRTWNFLAYAWMGVLFYALVTRWLLELPLLLHRTLGWWRRRQPAANPHAPAATGPDLLSRRRALVRAAAGATVLGSAGAGIAGIRSALYELATVTVPVRVPRLPAGLDGIRVVQISDLHVGPLLDEGFVRAVTGRVNALRPDLVVVTGDVVDGPVHHLEALVAPLGGLDARWGTFFVTGNHEYYSGFEPWIQHFAKLGMRVLANERVAVGDAGPGGASFDLAGVHDWHGGRRNTSQAPDLDAALAGRDPERALVLLAHQPAQIDQAAAAGVGLQISGHTHGGQMWPFGALTMLAQPYLRGLHQHAPGSQIYVSSGTGFWGPPLRVFAPAEITELVLTV